MTSERCPICLGTHLDSAEVTQASGGYRVDCPSCGPFAISEEAWEDILDPQSAPGSKLSAIQRAHLSHRVRRATIDGEKGRPKLDSDSLGRFIADGCPGPTPAEQVERLIELVGDHVSKTGEPLKSLPSETYALIGSPNPAFAGNLAIELVDYRILTGVPDKPVSSPPSMLNVGLSIQGWERYHAAKHGEFSGSLGFIAMKFGDCALDGIVEQVVKPAVREIGYNIVDMRDVARAGVIDNLMRAQIRDSAFVIVDLTHDNFGAYWEAGYAEGLGKPVIYICEREKFKLAQTHFDTNHCTTVMWSDNQREGFKRELIATLRRSLNLFPNSQ